MSENDDSLETLPADQVGDQGDLDAFEPVEGEEVWTEGDTDASEAEDEADAG